MGKKEDEWTPDAVLKGRRLREELGHNKEPRLKKPKGRWVVNVAMWIKKLALPKDDELWMEVVWSQLVRRNKRGQKLVIWFIDMLMIRFTEVAKNHAEYCEKNPNDAEDYAERAEAIRVAIREAKEAQAAMRHALEMYYRHCPFGLDGDRREERLTKGRK